MKPAQYLPDRQIASILHAFYGNPAACPFPQSALKPFPDLRFPDERPVTVDVDLLSDLLKEGVERYDDDNNALDQWLAPRVHNVVRVPRRIASDRRFWAWIAMDSGLGYIRHRWRNERLGAYNPYRFTGPHLRNGISRLWWAAELSRNGRDYGPVTHVLRGVRVAQFALELKYSWYRPAVIAFAEVCRDRLLNDALMQSLSVRVNAYLGTRPVELVGLDEGTTSAYDAAWWAAAPPSDEELYGRVPEGPDDCIASREAIDRLKQWFNEIVDEFAAEAPADSAGSTRAGGSRKRVPT
jgi:hypothetical protein